MGPQRGVDWNTRMPETNPSPRHLVAKRIVIERDTGLELTDEDHQALQQGEVLTRWTDGVIFDQVRLHDGKLQMRYVEQWKPFYGMQIGKL